MPDYEFSIDPRINELRAMLVSTELVDEKEYMRNVFSGYIRQVITRHCPVDENLEKHIGLWAYAQALYPTEITILYNKYSDKWNFDFQYDLLDKYLYCDFKSNIIGQLYYSVVDSQESDLDNMLDSVFSNAKKNIDFDSIIDNLNEADHYGDMLRWAFMNYKIAENIHELAQQRDIDLKEYDSLALYFDAVRDIFGSMEKLEAHLKLDHSMFEIMGKSFSTIYSKDSNPQQIEKCNRNMISVLDIALDSIIRDYISAMPDR